MSLLRDEIISHLRRRLKENDHHTIDVRAMDTLPIFTSLSCYLGTIQIGEDLAEERILMIDHYLDYLLRWHKG